ncbi:MAG: glutamine amidotransferase-related protein [Gammaproteobacteria bacterium WSBS_2016_MAG_OTU1]
MKIGLLNLYEVDTDLRDAHGNYASMFARLLAPEITCEWQVYEAREGDLPQNADECDAYLITGSRCGVYENWEWIPPLFDCIKMLNNAQKKLVGICFGHQAVAQALGGEVQKSDNGWGVGRHQWEITNTTPWMQPPLTKLNMLVSHQDQIITLPPQAQLLASSSFCQYAMYAIGNHIFCVQGHPEFTPEFMLALLQRREDTIPADVWREAMENSTMPNDNVVFAQWLANFFAQ